jgi:hypothetical protein
MENDQQDKSLTGEPVPGNEPVKVASTKKMPYCGTGLVTMNLYGNTRKTTQVGTGIMIRLKMGSAFVLTAASNVCRISSHRASAVRFTRALNDPREKLYADWEETIPYPHERTPERPSQTVEVFSKDIFVPDKYDGDEVAYNYALLRLSSRLFDDVLDQPDLLISGYGKWVDEEVQVNGYGYFDDRCMTHATGKIIKETSERIIHSIPTNRFAYTGAPILLAEESVPILMGIHTSSFHSASAGRNFGLGIPLTEEIWRQLHTWMDM